jgi:hypothetical protein
MSDTPDETQETEPANIPPDGRADAPEPVGTARVTRIRLARRAKRAEGDAPTERTKRRKWPYKHIISIVVILAIAVVWNIAHIRADLSEKNTSNAAYAKLQSETVKKLVDDGIGLVEAASGALNEGDADAELHLDALKSSVDALAAKGVPPAEVDKADDRGDAKAIRADLEAQERVYAPLLEAVKVDRSVVVGDLYNQYRHLVGAAHNLILSGDVPPDSEEGERIQGLVDDPVPADDWERLVSTTHTLRELTE